MQKESGAASLHCASSGPSYTHACGAPLAPLSSRHPASAPGRPSAQAKTGAERGGVGREDLRAPTVGGRQAKEQSQKPQRRLPRPIWMD